MTDATKQISNSIRIGDLYLRVRPQCHDLLIGTWDNPYQEMLSINEMKILRKFVNDSIMELEFNTTKQTK